MATEDIKLEHRGHYIVVPYDAVVMIMIAKETAGYPIQPHTTLVDEYIARIMKFYPATEESKKAVVDYRVLLDGFTVNLIYKEVTAGGGIHRRFPGKEPKMAAEILGDLLWARGQVDDWRGLDDDEDLVVEDLKRNWVDAYLDYTVNVDVDMDETETNWHNALAHR